MTDKLFHVRPGERWLLVRPWSVLKVQLLSFFRSFLFLSDGYQLTTYSDQQVLWWFPLRIRYLVIEELPSGKVLYENPRLSEADRRLVDRFRLMYARRIKLKESTT